MKPDVWDLVTVVGLALLGHGLWLVYPPLAWIIMGAVLAVFGTWGSRGGGDKSRAEG